MTEDREQFHFGALVYDVTAAKELVSALDPEGAAVVETHRLSPILGFIVVDPDAATALPDEALDEPLIAVQTGHTWTLIDGHHRLHAAIERGRDTLRVHVLPRESTDHVERPLVRQHR